MNNKIDEIISKYEEKKFKRQSNFELFKSLLRFSRLKKELLLFAVMTIMVSAFSLLTFETSIHTEENIKDYYNLIFFSSPFIFSIFIGYCYLYDYQDNILDLISTTPITKNTIYIFNAIVSIFKTMIINIIIAILFTIFFPNFSFFNIWMFSTTIFGIYLLLILSISKSQLIHPKTLIVSLAYMAIPFILKGLEIDLYYLYISVPIIVHILAVIILTVTLVMEIRKELNDNKIIMEI